MDGSGYIATVGDFMEDGGLLYSNASYCAAPTRKYYTAARNMFKDDAFAY